MIGVVVLGLTFLLDLPETDETGAIGSNFEGAEGSAGPGLYLEGIAGVAGAGRGRAAGSAAASSLDRPPPRGLWAGSGGSDSRLGRALQGVQGLLRPAPEVGLARDPVEHPV